MEENQVVDAGQVDVDNDSGPDIESEARSQGWVPKEEFKGNPNHWRDAEEFVEFGQRLNPLLRKQKEALTKELEEVKRQLNGVKSTAEQIISMRQKEMKEEYEGQIQLLKLQVREARTQGDFDTADQYQEQLDVLKENKPEFDKKPEKNDSQVAFTTEEYQEWEAENKWAIESPAVAKLAQSLALRMWAQDKTVTGRAFLDAVKEEVKEIKPELFQKRTRSMVESSSNGVSASSKTTYDRLPPDAKAHADQFVKDKLGSREDYVKLYNAAK